MIRLLLIGFCFISLVFGDEYHIRSGKVTYFGDHYLHQWQGVSETVTGQFIYDDINQNYNCVVSIPLTTFLSGNSNRDSNMLTYCRAIEFPNIEFESTEVLLASKNTIGINGHIRFAGKTKIINLIVELSDNEKEGLIRAEGEFKINLSDFNIDRPSLLFAKINDTIKVEYVIEGEINE